MPNDPALLGYLYCAVKRNLSNITSKSRGSVIKFITKGNIADYEIAVPPIPEMNEIIKYLNQILRAIDANKRGTALLKELRDVLLPKLMSGEIDVTKVDLMQLNSHLGQFSAVFKIKDWTVKIVTRPIVGIHLGVLPKKLLHTRLEASNELPQIEVNLPSSLPSCN